MLKTLELRGTLACLLAPVHAAQVRRALELLGPEQGLIVLMPDEAALPLALHCDDFSDEVAKHRLFFAVGDGWKRALRELFKSHPGLPTPNLFLRPPTTADAVAQPLIEGAQEVFKEAIAMQGRRREEIAGRPVGGVSKGRDRVCVVAPSVFRLWGDAGEVLAETLGGVAEVVRFDPDRPTTASQVAIAGVVRECDALVTANFGRSDLPAPVVPADMPWVTWVTTPVVPSGQRAAAGDRLVVADGDVVEAALRVGWGRSQVTVGGWPAVRMADAPAGGPVVLIADTRPIQTDIDEDTFEFSSHMVLWELIASELHTNPLLVATDVEAYLASRMARLSIGAEGFNRGMFLDQLIYPAYQQGVARLMLAAKLPARLYGRGWDGIPEFAANAGGEIRSRGDLHAAVAAAAVLVRPGPGRSAHAIDAMPRPVITPAGSPDAFVRGLKSAGRAPGTGRSGPAINADLVMSLLRRG
jgi:hypothetical protein